METTPSTSPAAKGRTVPVRTGTIVRTVVLMLVAISTREVSTVGTIEVVTSETTVAAILNHVRSCSSQHLKL
jgi:hypothetical protein